MNWLQFAKLALKRQVGFEIKDYSNYHLFQEFQAKEILKEIEKLKIPIWKFKVLELAAGVGGYSPTLYQSCQYLVSSDIYQFPNYINQQFLDHVIFDAGKKYPFSDNSFDLIFCSSLIEHVENPDEMLKEIRRVLSQKGYLYLSFPPFYSPYGGHYFSPFHLIGEKNAIKITKKLNKNISSEVTSYSNCWGEGRGLFRRTIRSVKKLLSESNFTVEFIWPRFFMKYNITKIPIINELLCWHVCFICRKSIK